MTATRSRFPVWFPGSPAKAGGRDPGLQSWGFLPLRQGNEPECIRVHKPLTVGDNSLQPVDSGLGVTFRLTNGRLDFPESPCSDRFQDFLLCCYSIQFK